jgi:hypothetical protein
VTDASSLGLRVPALAAAPASYPLLDARGTDAWFDALPKTHFGELARQVYQGLHQFTRVEMPDSRRIEVAERFAAAVDYLVDNVQRHYTDTAFPLGEKAAQVAALVRELDAELANSYKIVIERILGGIHETDDQRHLTIALNRSVRHLGRTLYRAVQVYQPWPAHGWHELHAVYAYATANGLAAQPVRERLADADSQAPTLAELYNQILVLAAAEPQRLRQREIDAVYRNGLRWGRALVIGAAEGAEVKPTHRLIDLSADKEPLLVERLSEPSRGRFLLVDLAPLAEALRAELEKAGEAPQEAHRQLLGGMLRRLSENWLHPAKRRFARTRLVFELRVLVGLAAIHGELSARQAAAAGGGPQRGPAPPRLTQEDVAYALAPLGLDLLAEDPAVAGPKDQPIAYTSEVPPASRAASATPSKAVTVRTNNESAGGYCIEWYAQSAPRVRVGEVLGVQSVHEEAHFSVGLIRWIQYASPESLQVGVELIAPQCRAVNSYVGDLRAIRDRRSLKTEPALLLPPVPAASQPATVLLPTIKHKADDVVWLYSETQDQLVRLGELVDATGACSRFAFEVLQESTHGKAPKPVKAGADTERPDFDNLWSNL